MTITAREMDMAQLESELRMQEIFDEWRRSFLAERMIDQAIRPQTAVNPPLIPSEVESGDIR